jgi:phosphonate transport system permease protein
MKRIAWGALTPDFSAVSGIGMVIVQTVAFALSGVALGAVGGFLLSQVFHLGPVRWGCAAVRAIHELFWALIFIQMLGLSPLTGVLAIAIPYAGICAKVYAETLSAFFFARLPDVWVHIKTYTSYRFECGLRSSTVLGFVGLPTLGFHLETAFSEGNYSEAAALLIIFYLLIATLRFWMRPKLIGFYILAAPFLLGSGAAINMNNIVRFVTVDIVPAPLRQGGVLDGQTWSSLGDWIWTLAVDQALLGMVSTLLLTQIALVATGVLALALAPLVSKKFFGPAGRTVGHVFLVVMRSTPEFILAYIFLQL